MSLNPNATPFTFNPNAGTFVPGVGFVAAQPQNQPSEEDKKQEEEVQAEAVDEEGDDEPIDENDPLWIAVLKIAEGDKDKAERMLADPDSLMQYPEVRAILESAPLDEAEDNWETAADAAAAQESKEAPDTAAAAAAPAGEEVEAPVARAPTEESKQAVEPVASADDDGAALAGVDDDVVVSDEDPREHVNLVFIGHVDAGKSTLSGNLLYLTDQVDKRTIEKYEREAKQRNRESWFLAFIMDTSEEERVKGITVEVGRAHFDTPAKRYTILDAPGHKSYVPNMITGASQADVGILVISARRGEFETGFEKGGQTREHALLAKTLGVKYLVVAINKMDDPTVEWAQERFDECVSKLKPYLKQCGYAIKKEVRFIPISGLNGANLKDEVSPDVCPWWRPMYESGANNTTDATLMQLLDNMALTDRDPAGSLRVPILDRFIDRGTIVMGKVERGRITVGQQVMIMPTRTQTTVTGIQINEAWVRSAKVGENVNIKLANVGVEDVQKGFVLCPVEDPVPVAVEIIAQVAVVDLPEHRPIFSAGYDAILHIHTVSTDVNVRRLISVTEKGVEKKARFAKLGQVVVVSLVVPESICVETFADLPQLGRLTLRDEGKTIGIGKVMQIRDLNRK